MADGENYYRIVIKPNSKYRIFFFTLLFIFYTAAVFHWPYFIPLLIKQALVSVSFVIWAVYLRSLIVISKEQILLLTEAGGLKHKFNESNETHGCLSKFSYFLPGVIHLRIINSVSNKNYWLTIFTDQIDLASKRRLRRIILSLKLQ